MTDLTRTAVTATADRLTGCAIGEVSGLAIGTATGLGAGRSSPSAFAPTVAFVVAHPVNRWPAARGRGHAVAHPHHHHPQGA